MHTKKASSHIMILNVLIHPYMYAIKISLFDVSFVAFSQNGGSIARLCGHLGIVSFSLQF